MDAQVVWRRPRTEPDPLTDRPVSIAPQILGTIWAAFEIARRTEPEPALRVETDPRLVITGALLRIIDTLDGRRVNLVNDELCVTFA